MGKVDRNDMALVMDNIQFDFRVVEQGKFYTNCHRIKFYDKQSGEIQIIAQLVDMDNYDVSDPKGVIQRTLDEIEEESSHY